MTGNPVNSELGYPENLVLASSSQSRAAMLRDAGLAFEVVPAEVDEAAIRDVLQKEGDMPPADVAEVLARAKAEAVSAAHPGAVVIAADQILALDETIFEKPDSMEDARKTLLALRGKTHQLHSAVVLASAGQVTWVHTQSASLTMRDLSAEDVGRYLAAAGEDILSSVGCYQLEALGVHLFEKIDGDYFTILGLPLLALLGQLREGRAAA